MVFKIYELLAGSELSYHNESLLRDIYPAKTLKIELIEISCSNPSAITLAIGYEKEIFDHQGIQWRHLPFHRHRKDIIYQNGTFFFDTANIAGMEINVNGNFVIKTISLIEGLSFKLDLYCSCDKRSQLADNIEYL